jgi:hypothetical protein
MAMSKGDVGSSVSCKPASGTSPAGAAVGGWPSGTPSARSVGPAPSPAQGGPFLVVTSETVVGMRVDPGGPVYGGRVVVASTAPAASHASTCSTPSNWRER